MGRPKVSLRNKNIALAFVKIVTRNEPGVLSEECISVNSQFGRKSLHSAMVHCLPHLTRSFDRVDNREVGSFDLVCTLEIWPDCTICRVSVKWS